MAKDKSYPQSTALAQREIEISLPNATKQSRTYGVLAKGDKLNADEATELAQLAAYDCIVGNLELTKIAIVLKAADITLAREDQIIRREEMAFKAEALRFRGVKTGAKRRSLER